jgi:RNA polymerase sigma-70 factor (ECF subfamily)
MARDDERLAQIESVYRRDFRRFLHVAIAVTGERERAFDAVQDGFANAIKSRSAFRGETAIGGWLWRCVVNAALESRRKLAPERSAAEQLPTANGAPEEPMSGLRACIALLPERQRLAIFLRYYADLDYRSIGDALGIETGTVSATLSAAHAALRRSLEGVET